MKEIQSIQNTIIKNIIKLKEKKYRQESKLFMVEGYHLIDEAYKHGLLKTILSTNKNDFLKYNVVEQYLVNDNIIKRLSTTVNPQGIIGVVKNPSFKDIDLNSNKLKIVLLDGINDPGNLGSIVRTSAALGYNAIYISLDSADMYNEKTLRATQGAIFKIPFFYGNLETVVNNLKKYNVKCIGTTLDAMNDLEKIESSDKFCVCFGNEAHGMSEKMKKIMNENIKIPMENNVESLNVLSASSIILYELKKRVTK